MLTVELAGPVLTSEQRTEAMTPFYLDGGSSSCRCGDAMRTDLGTPPSRHSAHARGRRPAIREVSRLQTRRYLDLWPPPRVSGRPIPGVGGGGGGGLGCEEDPAISIEAIAHHRYQDQHFDGERAGRDPEHLQEPLKLVVVGLPEPV